MTESTQKVYPYKEEDLTYEKEITDAIKKLPLEQRFQAIALNHYSLIKKRLDEGIDSEIDEIVKKYNSLQTPLANRANQIIAGEAAPLEEELVEAKNYLSDEDKQNLANHINAEAIPDYWFKVLSKCDRLSQDVWECDHECLKKLRKIEHIPSDENENFEFKLYFDKNDFFENEYLRVKFFLLEDGQDPEKSEADEIKWKEGKDFTKKKVTKKQKNKKTGKTRTVERVVDADSFFNVFKTIEPERENGEGGDEEDENLDKLSINFELATVLQEEIVPYHLEYYLGLRKGEDYGFPQAGGDDDDDDDDDDEPEEKPKKKESAGGKKGGAAGKAAADKPECKQQ